MKRWLCLLLLGVFFSGHAWAESPEDLFSRAVKAYQAGRYDESVQLNEKIINGLKLESPAVYFNLGNGYFKQGKLGKAIQNYLLAQRMAPRDADIKANLTVARQSVERYETDFQAQSSSRLAGLFSAFSAAELKWLALFLFMLTGAVYLGCLYAGLPQKRVVLLTSLSLLASFYVGMLVSHQLSAKLGRAVVLHRTEARFEPNGQATVYFKLSEGMELKILRHQEGWVKVQRNDGRVAWVMDKVLGEL